MCILGIHTIYNGTDLASLTDRTILTDMPYHKSIELKLKDMMSNDNDIINVLDTLSELLNKHSLDKRIEGYRQQADILRFIAHFIESETRSFEMMVK